MTDYSKPLRKLCEGCDHERFDVRTYKYRTPHGETGTADWCSDCRAVASFSGPIGAFYGAGMEVEEVDESK